MNHIKVVEVVQFNEEIKLHTPIKVRYMSDGSEVVGIIRIIEGEELTLTYLKGNRVYEDTLKAKEYGRVYTFDLAEWPDDKKHTGT